MDEDSTLTLGAGDDHLPSGGGVQLGEADLQTGRNHDTLDVLAGGLNLFGSDSDGVGHGGRGGDIFLPVRSIEFLERNHNGRFPSAPGILTVDTSGIASLAVALVRRLQIGLGLPLGQRPAAPPAAPAGRAAGSPPDRRCGWHCLPWPPH